MVLLTRRLHIKQLSEAAVAIGSLLVVLRLPLGPNVGIMVPNKSTCYIRACEADSCSNPKLTMPMTAQT